CSCIHTPLLFLSSLPQPPKSTLFPYTTLFRSEVPSSENVTYTILKEHDKEELLTFLHRCFPGRWEYESTYYFKQGGNGREFVVRSEEHTSELQSRFDLVCRLLLEKKKKTRSFS